MNKQSKVEKKKKVLVVDDDIDITRLVEKTLNKTNEYQVKAVNDPARAVGVARSYKPDLILLDTLMPEISGVEIATRLSHEEKLFRIPIIFVSSLLDKKDTGKTGRKIGEYMCLAKPFRPEELLSCVEKTGYMQRQ